MGGGGGLFWPICSTHYRVSADQRAGAPPSSPPCVIGLIEWEKSVQCVVFNLCIDAQGQTVGTIKKGKYEKGVAKAVINIMNNN